MQGVIEYIDSIEFREKRTRIGSFLKTAPSKVFRPRRFIYYFSGILLGLPAEKTLPIVGHNGRDGAGGWIGI